MGLARKENQFTGISSITDFPDISDLIEKLEATRVELLETCRETPKRKRPKRKFKKPSRSKEPLPGLVELPFHF
ncbi:MAG: hypothetical protein H7A24_17250 [Leptospiraceae bacterium]|nr:hypothetical protein [Leptospiraceae bacterium]MCP5513639.1 hypothetical protein [Leptospiraceae bacterium]